MRTDAALEWAVEAFKDDRNAHYEHLRQYMQGEHDLMFATDKFISAFGRLFRPFRYNRCGMVVDAHADRMQIEGFSTPDKTRGERATEIWNDNGMRSREGHAEVDAFGLGDAYVIAEVHPRSGKMHYWIQDPTQVRVKYSLEVPGERLAGAKAWHDPDTGHWRLNVYHPDRTEKYITRARESSMPTQPGQFTRFDGELVGGWTFRHTVPDVVPVFHIPNNGRTGGYGVSELEPVIPLQNAMNKTLMDMLVAMEFAAYPQRVIIGAEPETDAQKLQLERFQTGIDRILTLFAPDAKIAEFTAANIGAYIAVAEFWDAAISRVTKVPVHYLGMSGEFSSGVARRLAEAPFTAKIEDRQAAAEHVWREVAAYSLRAERVNVDASDIDVKWKPAAPLAEEEVIDRALQLDTLGVPLEDILENTLGWDQDRVRKVMAAKAVAVESAMRVFNAGQMAPSIDDDDDTDEPAVA